MGGLNSDDPAISLFRELDASGVSPLWLTQTRCHSGESRNSLAVKRGGLTSADFGFSDGLKGGN
ncbi:MAG: hypothetical protein P9M15_06775 [Candidatus Electryoneaceae bacterium]|nr:hypothetical protein [Candidatus Electryoneaceae bacterium]